VPAALSGSSLGVPRGLPLILVAPPNIYVFKGKEIPLVIMEETPDYQQVVTHDNESFMLNPRMNLRPMSMKTVIFPVYLPANHSVGISWMLVQTMVHYKSSVVVPSIERGRL